MEEINIKQDIKCRKCGINIGTYSPMRKWCVDCRRIVGLEQAKERKQVKKKLLVSQKL